MAPNIEFRQLLIDLDDAMSDEDRKRFVFMLSDDIPKRKRNESLVEIFTILIDRGRISAQNCSYLVDMLGRAKLEELAYRVARFEMQSAPPIAIPTISENAQPDENVNPICSGVQGNHQTHTKTIQDLLNDYNETDSMIITSDSEQNTPVEEKLLNIELVQAPAHLCLETDDLKIFESGVWSAEFLERINVKVRPYEYQRELVQAAIQARNTIICLRTGSGKTFVAALLLKYYATKKMASTNGQEIKFSAFFIVPRRAMLKQIYEKLKQIGNLRIIACDEALDIVTCVKNFDVIICTPQKLLNCLKAKTVFISDIDLLCFDECDDTVVRHQYTGIMQYILCKDIECIPPVHSSPIIIGLTATLGVSRLANLQIVNHLATLCAKFDCSTITTVLKTENGTELEKFTIHSPEDEIICVGKRKEFDSLRLSIEKELKKFIFHLFSSKDTNPSRIFPEKEMDMNGYEQNLEILKQSEQKSQHFVSDILLNYILAIYRHIKALNDLTPELVLSDLKYYFDKKHKNREHPLPIDRLIYEKCQNLVKQKLTEIQESNQVLSNPKLDKLVELLKINSEKPNHRALVLVERMFYAQKICEYLRDHSELKNIVNACYLVGQDETYSKNSNKSECSVLQDFRNGLYNVMISTDVVQAGLDIPQCSLVIRYDFVPDGIGSIQARVRARTLNCKYYLLTMEGSQNYDKELDNHRHEKALEEMLEIWKRIPSDQFRERVIQKQKLLVKEWKEAFIKPLVVEKNIPKNTELTGDILCRACDYLLGKLSRLRQNGQAYFISDHDFYNRIEEKLLPERKEYVKTFVTGQTLCGNKNCRAELGCIQVSKDCLKLDPIYPLKCQSIKIKYVEKVNGQETIILKRQWKQMPFKIPPFEIEDAQNSDDIFYDAFEVITVDSER